MRTVLRLTLMLAIAGAAGAAHALESGDWDALEDTAQHSLEYARTRRIGPLGESGLRDRRHIHTGCDP